MWKRVLALGVITVLAGTVHAQANSGLTEGVGASDYGTFVAECKAIRGPHPLDSVESGLCIGRIAGYLDSQYIAENGDVMTVGMDGEPTCLFNRFDLNEQTVSRNTMQQAIMLASIVVKHSMRNYDVPWQRGLTVLLMRMFKCHKPLGMNGR